MEIKIKVRDIDYDKIIRAVLPMLKEKAAESDNKALKMVAGILKMPGDIPLKMLAALPQETKDDLVIYLFDHYKAKIIEAVHNVLTEKGFEVSIEDIEITK